MTKTRKTNTTAAVRGIFRRSSAPTGPWRRYAITTLARTARSSFSGYSKILRLSPDAPEMGESDGSPDENQLIEELRETLDRTADELNSFRKLLLRFFADVRAERKLHLFSRQLHGEGQAGWEPTILAVGLWEHFVDLYT